MSNEPVSPIVRLADDLSDALTQVMTLAGTGSGDMFLSVTGTRQGAMAGESVAPGYEGQIAIRGWKWGLIGADAMAGKTGGRRSAKALTVFKNVDSASTKLMSALSTREKLKDVTLTMRRSGDDQVAFMSITLGSALVVTHDMQGLPDGSLLEQVSFQFVKVDVVYNGQARSGQNKAGMSFSDDFNPELT